MSHSGRKSGGIRNGFLFAAQLVFVLAVGAATVAADTLSDLRGRQVSADNGSIGRNAGGMHELTELRRINSNTYDVGDGKRMSVVTIHPQYYVAADGSLQPIDPTVEQSGLGAFAFENNTNILRSRFGRTDARVSADAGSASLQYEPAATRFSSQQGSEILGQARSTRAVGSGSVVSYSGVLPNIDVRYTVSEGGITQDFILSSPPSAPGTGVSEDAVFEIGERLSITGGSLTTVNGDAVVHGTETQGALLLRADGQTLRLGAPFATEQIAGSPAQTDAIPGSYRVEVGADGAVMLWTRIPYAWLADPARQYPVVIDPTLDLQPDGAAGKDAQLVPIVPANNWGTREFLTDNWGTVDARGVLEFDLSSIPAGSSVSSATLTLWHHWNSEFTSMDIHAVTESWNENTVTWNTMPAHDPTVTDSHVPGSGSMQFEDWNVTSDVADWVAGTSSNFGWMLKSGSANMTAYYYSSDHNSVPERRPRLVVVYEAGGGGGGDCDLTPIEAKLDDETRFTDDAELAEVLGALDSLQSDVAMLEAKADAAAVAHDELLRLGETIRMSIIEHDLAQEKEGSKLMALTCLPEAQGGNLEFARALVQLRIDSLEAAGCDSSALDQARAELATGDEYYDAGQYIRACDLYAKAYHSAGVHCP